MPLLAAATPAGEEVTASGISAEDYFRRILYTNDKDGCFITGNVERHAFKQLKAEDAIPIFLILKENPDKFFEILNIANNDKALPRRCAIQFVLAVALLKTEDANLKSKISQSILTYCKDDAEFFNFIRHFTNLNNLTKNKISTSVQKVIKKFYESKTALQMAEDVTRNKSFHGWRHKDLIKLAHYKSESELKNIVTKYVLFGLEKIEKSENNDVKKIIDILNKSKQLRTTDDELVAAVLISELGADISQVNQKLRKSPEIWSSILSTLSCREILSNLPKLYKYGLLKMNTPVHIKIIETLTSAEKVKECNLHPLEVFIYLKNFEKGGKPMDPKLINHLKAQEATSPGIASGEKKSKIQPNPEPKLSIIANSITKSLNMSYNNVKSCNKKFMVTIDVTDRMDKPCLHNPNITCLEASVAITLFLLKTEKNVTVSFYKDKDLHVLNVDKNMSFAHLMQIMKEHKSSYVYPAAPYEWAINKKKKFDFFVSFYHFSPYTYPAPKEIRSNEQFHSLVAHNKYKTKMNLPNTKLITIALGVSNLCAHYGKPNATTICGFTVETPKVLESFIKGSYI